MGNRPSRSSQYHAVANSDRAMFEPLVGDGQETQREERARIAEAFHFSGPKLKPKTSEDDDSDDDDNPAEKLIDESETSDNNPIAVEEVDPFANLREVDGLTVLVHVLSPEDTLAGLSLRYGVSTDDIRRANFMIADDRLVSHTKLIIPAMGKKGIIDDNASMREIDLADGEKGLAHRQRLIYLLRQMDTNNLGESSAEYYLEQNGFNLKKALEEAERDAAWERKNMRGVAASKGLPWNLYNYDQTLPTVRG